MEALKTGPSLVEKLANLNSETVDVDGTPLELLELDGQQAIELWGALTAAEQTGNMLEAYCLLILHGARGPSGAPAFPSLESVKRLPARRITFLGEIMLKLCDMGLEAGNASGVPDEILPIG